MESTAQDRRVAHAQLRDLAKVELESARLSAIIGGQAMRVLAAAYRNRRLDLAAMMRRQLMTLAPLVSRVVLYSMLLGLRRARRTMTASFDMLDDATGALGDTLGLSPADLLRFQEMAETRALTIANGLAAHAERRIRATLRDITAENLHVKAGVERLQETFDNLGLTPSNSFTLEALFRTQTQLAYAAAKQEQEQDPDVDDVLWGYRYVTVGDYRVRPSHAALDGTTAPKDDPIWKRIYPPNGWACRCQCVPLFEPAKVKKPKDKVKIDGKTVVPGPDKGFEGNPLLDLARMVHTKAEPVEVRPDRVRPWTPPVHPVYPAVEAPKHVPSTVSVPVASPAATKPAGGVALLEAPRPTKTIVPETRQESEAKPRQPIKESPPQTRDAKPAKSMNQTEVANWWSQVRHDALHHEAIKAYTLDDYAAMRKGQYEGKAPSSIAQKIKAMNAALKLAPKHEGTVFRGMAIPSEMAESLKAEGQLSVLGAHASSSAAPYVAGRFAGKAKRATPNNVPVVLKIKQRSGVNISGLSQIEGEKEILLRKNTRYRTVSHRTVTYEAGEVDEYGDYKKRPNVRNVLEIELEEVDDQDGETIKLSMEVEFSLT